jgi:hypothetical protein
MYTRQVSHFPDTKKAKTNSKCIINRPTQEEKRNQFVGTSPSSWLAAFFSGEG